VNVVKKYFHKGSNYISRLISSDNNSSEKLGHIFTHFLAVIFVFVFCGNGENGGVLCGGCCVNLRHNCKLARMSGAMERRGQLRRLVMTAMTAAAASAFE